MGERVRLAVAVSVAAVTAAVATAHAAPPATARLRPTVVVAVADTGVNPYHQAFYRPANTAHPCTWVKGFTNCSIPALNLSVGKHRDVAAAFAADRAVWASVRPHQWYWIPRTNIIGAVCDRPVGGGAANTAVPPEGPIACIFDENGHGTGTTSSVLSEAPDALLLVHEGNSGGLDLATAPVTADVQSHSWGSPALVVPVPVQVARPLREDPCPVGQARPETLVFLAAGNEAPVPSLLDCARAKPEIQVVGGAYPGYFEAKSWSVFDFASWSCRPAASNQSVTESEVHCGTSFSAPTAAGTAAAALLRVRQRDRYVGRSSATQVSPSLTRAAFVQALRDAASYTPKAKFPDQVPCLPPTTGFDDPCSIWRAGWAPLPAQAPHLFWGYGWLDSTITDAVVSCALGRACPAKSAEAQSYNEQRQELKEAAGLYVLAPGTGNDAASGRDAGDDPESAVGITAGRTYQGSLQVNQDWRDAYALRARAGQELTITSSATTPAGSAAGCWVVRGPDGEELTEPVAGNLTACQPGAPPPSGLTLPTTGTYTLVYQSYVAQDYSFAVALAA